MAGDALVLEDSIDFLYRREGGLGGKREREGAEE